MNFYAGSDKGNTNLAIYEVDGDNWKLYLATRAIVRPPVFAATPGTCFTLEALVRHKP